MSSKVVIVNYGTGNLNSVKKGLQRLKIRSVDSSDADCVATADKIILPGVGHFRTAMANLEKLHLIDALNEAVLKKGTPILGICLGMELMAKRSEEGNVNGLGWIDAETVRFKVANKERYKVPHMGWNRIHLRKDSALMSEIDDLSEFYFAHSYYLRINDGNDLLNETRYEDVFTSAIERDNIFGVQYHPEKSHDAGAQLLKNFVAL